jgi:Flp pilus assembly protein TadG
MGFVMDLLNRRNASNRRIRGGRRGLSLVETTIVLPVFLLMIFGLIDFSFVMHDYLVAHNAARATVRAATLASSGGSCTDAGQRSKATQVGTGALKKFIRAKAQAASLAIATEAGKDLCDGGLVTATVKVEAPLTLLKPFVQPIEPLAKPIKLEAVAAGQNENIELN